MIRNRVYTGDARQLAQQLPDRYIHCIITSPPYYGLRDYGTGGAQIGLESSMQEYIDEMVMLFRELRRALRNDGTVWLNLGDSYNGSGGAGGDYNSGGLKDGQPRYPGRNENHLKPKDLMGIPWRVALALQADGWWLRSDIIWHKPNPMPESVTDRPTKAHEYIFLLSKSAKYYYDADAISEKMPSYDFTDRNYPNRAKLKSETKRNKRSVWTVTTKPYKQAHFATFPPDLIKPCILAGTSARGVCSVCGAPWARVVERKAEKVNKKQAVAQRRRNEGASSGGTDKVTLSVTEYVSRVTTGWQFTCDCEADTVPAIVLDPFMGSGTVAQVAIETGRDYIGFELNSDYVQLANRRIKAAQPVLFAEGIA